MEETTQNSQQPQRPASGPKSNRKNTGMAIVAYIIFFIPLLTDAKNDPFVKYHVKQGLTLFLAGVVVWLFMNVIPVLGLFIAPILNIILLILLILGIINAAKGLEKPLPIIGHFADNFKF